MNIAEIIEQSMLRYFCTLTYFFDYCNVALMHVVFICVCGLKISSLTKCERKIFMSLGLFVQVE